MAIKEKRYLDYDGLQTYDEFIKQKMSEDLEDLGTILTDNITNVSDTVNTLATYSPLDDSAVLTGGLIKEYVDTRFEKSVEGETNSYPLYYKMEIDPDTGELVHVFDYDAASGTAVDGETYYERQGTGSTADPYRYVECDPQPEIGDSVEGLYTQGEAQTTTAPTEEELDYPVIDPETGEQVEEEVTEVDQSTTDTIIKTMSDYATISDNEIIDLFED